MKSKQKRSQPQNQVAFYGERQFQETLGSHNRELEMYPRRVRRFPKAVRYNVKMEYSQPPGWIRRTPEGKFVLNDDEDDDDGGFLSVPGIIMSPMSHVLPNEMSQHLYVNSNVFANSSQSYIDSYSPRDSHLGHMSGNSLQSFGRGEIPSFQLPRDHRIRTSSPGFNHLEDFRSPIFIEELSSVVQPSSVERSFPSMISSKLSPSMHLTPTGQALHCNHSNHREPSALGIIHENSPNIQGHTRQFRPIHRPIPRLRALQAHQEENHGKLHNFSGPPPYLRGQELSGMHHHVPRSHHLAKLHTNKHFHDHQHYPKIPRGDIRISSAPLPSEMNRNQVPRNQYLGMRPERNTPPARPWSVQHFSPCGQLRSSHHLPPKPIRYYPDRARLLPYTPNHRKFSPKIVSYMPDLNNTSDELVEAFNGVYRGYNDQRFKAEDHHTSYSPEANGLPEIPSIGTTNRFTPISVRTTPLLVHDYRNSPARFAHSPRMHNIVSRNGRPYSSQRISYHSRLANSQSPLCLNPEHQKFKKSPAPYAVGRMDRQIARVPPSSAKDGMIGEHLSSEKSPFGTLVSNTTDNQPVEYTRDQLQGAIERVRSTAISRGSIDQPFRNSAPELSDTSFSLDPTTTAKDTPGRSNSTIPHAMAERGGAIPSRSADGKSEDDPALNDEVQSVNSWTSSGRGSKPASVVHSNGDSLQEEFDSQMPSSSSGFGSRNTSNLHSTISNNSNVPSTNQSMSFKGQIRDEARPESPQSEPIPCVNPLNISVDENYEFDPVSPLDTDFIDKLHHYGSRRGSNSSGDRGVSDSEIYASRSHPPRPKRAMKFDNTEARCNALKQEYLRFRQKQEELQLQRQYSELESAC